MTTLKNTDYIPLDRRLSPVSENQDAENQESLLPEFPFFEYPGWSDILKEYRCVILAEAGAGKTEEFKQQALDLNKQGHPSFFIRIEDIDSHFEEAFDVGSPMQFRQWLANDDEGWFFLDSVDEARLKSPAAFRKAIGTFANRIINALHRAHIFVSSRPYAWRPLEDRKLMDEKLLIAAPPKSDQPPVEGDADADANNNNRSLKVLILRPLNSERIKRYCLARGVEHVDELLNEIDRLNLWRLAERPFDLESIIAKWQVDKVLGSRIELLRHNIKVKLTDQHSTDRASVQTLTLERAKKGARRLAAAVVLTGKAGILIPGSRPNPKSISANELLSDWSAEDVTALLALGVFNDIIYDTVRFRHREIRELLAAEWFEALLKSAGDNNSIKALIFREQYGEKIITPTLRPVLSWLILFDNDCYKSAIAIAPELAVEGGDPAILPLLIREQLLEKIVQEIVADKDNKGARDNRAIARIAAPDLTPKTIELINSYRANDDAIFFLGRLAWQGKMVTSLPLFEDIVLDSQRGIYARIAALRAIVTLGAQDHCTSLWINLNNIQADCPAPLLSEFLTALPSSFENVKQLLVSIDKLAPTKHEYGLSSIRDSLTAFIGKLSVQNDRATIDYLLNGLVQRLNRAPFENHLNCKVSTQYAWLASDTAQILEKVIEARCELALCQKTLTTLLYLSKLKHYLNPQYNDYKDSLQNLIPKWPELNDALYWASIKQTRSELEAKGPRLVDEWDIDWDYRYWVFDEVSYKRLLNSLPSIECEDDQLVALSTVIRVYQQTGKSPKVLDDLKAAVEGNLTLQESLQASIGPRMLSESESESRQRLAAMQREAAAKKLLQEKQRQEWVKYLKDYIDKINDTEALKLGQLPDAIVWLFDQTSDDPIHNTKAKAQWQALIPEFGEAVAKEYRTAVVSFWRHCDVKPQSELAEYDNTITTPLLVAMAGLEIESHEEPTFPHHLSPSELQQALKYLTQQLNGLPYWLESLYKAFPEATLTAVKKELTWGLERTKTDEHRHDFLHDLLYCAPWIHQALAPFVLDWLIDHPEKIADYPEYCIIIILRGYLDPARVIELTKREIARVQPIETQARWFALWVDCQAEAAIPAIEQWLEKLTDQDAKTGAERFIITLMGSPDNISVSCYETYITPQYLKELSILVHRYVKSEDDIDNTNNINSTNYIERPIACVYTPNIRINAQSARDYVLSRLTNIEGKAAYLAMKALAREHPAPNCRSWMAKQAFKRAETDGDIEPWSVEQVYQFEQEQAITPKTHRQLFDLGIQKLNNLKTWLEQGNDSPSETWQKADRENEVRNLIAGWLNQNSRDQYTVVQEPELANSQRMDIWFTSNHGNVQVPIELKLLDKGWSGNKLCERLQNQLVGDYLRDNKASCGVMLLVAAKTTKTWQIAGQKVPLKQLRDALMDYWKSIADDYPKIDAIEVIVIDLNLRSKVSTTPIMRD